MFKPFLISFVVFFTLVSTAFARETVEINWATENQLSFQGMTFKNKFSELPFFTQFIKVKNGQSSLELGDLEFAAMDNADIDLDLLSEEFQIKQTVLEERKQYKIALEIVPLRIRNGQVEKLLSFSFVENNDSKSALLRKRTRTYKDNSVLNSGDWYKLGIKTSGIYRIDAAVIEAIGLNPSNVNPSHVHVYGHRGGMLPMAAGDSSVVDDLAALSLKVMDNGNGGFDGNDAVVFYAEGPEKWIYDPSKNAFIHENHDYSDFKGLMLTIK